MAMVNMVCIGDELLDGRTREGNGFWLGGWLRRAGHRLVSVTLVADDRANIVAALRRAANGTYTPLSARKSLLGRGDVLVSYLPSPGTVVYLGYGTGVDATETMRPIDVQRTTDGAFVKFSYLYRVRGTTR